MLFRSFIVYLLFCFLLITSFYHITIHFQVILLTFITSHTLFTKSMLANCNCHWSRPYPFICCSSRIEVINCSTRWIPSIHCISRSIVRLLRRFQIYLSITYSIKSTSLIYYTSNSTRIFIWSR